MRDDRRLPDWLAERAALGEAPDVVLDPARRADLEASNRAILDALPPERVAAEVERRHRVHAARAAAAASRRRTLFGVGLAAAAAAAIGLVLATRTPRAQVAQRDDAPETTRIKGDARLVVHRKHGDRIERLIDGDRAAAGDLIQVAYVAAGARFGVIASIDGRGAVTVHLPLDGATAPALDQGGAVPAPSAYELDDAPGFERFVLVTSDRAFAVETVTRAAAKVAAADHAQARRLELPPELAQHSFLLRKDDRR